MLSVFAVGVIAAQPAILDRVPLTPELLAGRWEMVYSNPSINDRAIFMFDKHGKFATSLLNSQTGADTNKNGRGLYMIDESYIITASMTRGAEGLSKSSVKVLAGNKLYFFNKLDGNKTILRKLSNKPGKFIE